MYLDSVVSTGLALQRFAGRRAKLERSVFFLVILRESAHFRAASTGMATGRTQAAPGLSINAVAATLDRPFETTRRHVHALIDAGLCVRTETGVTVPQEVIESDAIGWLLTHLHDVTVRFFAHLAAFEVRAPRGRIAGDYDRVATVAAAIDLLLDTFEVQSPRYASWLELIVLHAVAQVGGRALGFDPALSQIYSGAATVPPEELRAAVSAAQLARGLNIPLSTITRQLNLSIGAGSVIQHHHGVKASHAFLSGLAIAGGGRDALARVARMRSRLAPAGFDFEDPATNYIGAAPALLRFD